MQIVTLVNQTNKMNVLVSVVVLLALVGLSSADQQQTAGGQLERQGRSVNGNANNNLGHNGNSNMIDLGSSSKSRIELEKREIQQFLTAKNIFKSIVKLLFGNQEEISATSRNVLGILGKVLEVLKSTFGNHKARSGTARTIRDSAEDAANAGVTMLQGYVKSVLTNDDRCVQRYLCQASKEAANQSRDLGYIIASVGGYASSYLLDSTKSANFKSLYEASMRGRSLNDDCEKLYAECSDDQQQNRG